MEIVYAAHTEAGTFMLDEGGVCRWAVAPAGKPEVQVPERIVGAQFVASLDLESPQGLAPLPEVGVPMLFAAVDSSGHISLVRTSPLLRFENKRLEKASGMRPLPSREDLTPIVSRPPPLRSDVAPRPHAPSMHPASTLRGVAPPPRHLVAPRPRARSGG
jgi:hypothetical protein